MSRFVTFAVSLTALAGIFAQVWAHPVRVRAYEPLTSDSSVNHIAVIGDSYTTGSDEGGRGPKGWTARAWQALAQRGIHQTKLVATPAALQPRREQPRRRIAASSRRRSRLSSEKMPSNSSEQSCPRTRQ